MTECPGSFAFFGDSYDGLTVGKIATNILLKIVDEEERNVGFNEKGEIRIKYEFGFAGYYKSPEANAEAVDAEGYFKTGDIGYFDENATLYVIDRIKETFKHNGYHASIRRKENFNLTNNTHCRYHRLSSRHLS